MLTSVTAWLKDVFCESGKADKRHGLRLAAAALMVEIGRADHEFSETERVTIIAALQNTLALTAQEADELLRLADPAVEQAVSLNEFTRLLNEQLPVEDRIRIVEALWQVAYADDGIDKYEEYYIRKIADLLYVPHSDYIRTKLRIADG